MIQAGILIKGSSNIEPNPKIKLNRCITFKQLLKYDYIILENVKKENLEDVKKLPKTASVYSIGACDAAIKQITFYISDISEILEEKDAVKKEKEASIQAIKAQTEKNVELEKELKKNAGSIGELQDRIKDLCIERDKYKSQSEQANKQLKALQDKYSAEVALRQKAEQNLKDSEDELARTLKDSSEEKEEITNNLNTSFGREIESIKKKLEENQITIQDKDNEIAELKRANEELGKSGAIPEITFNYTGKAQIIGVCGQGSYGVSEMVNFLGRNFANQKKTLIVDLDFKVGNIEKYMASDNKSIENALKGGPIFKEHIISAQQSGTLDYIGGVTKDWTPYEILQLPWDKIFGGDYEYIIVDCGIYGGYNIQTVICNFIKRIGKLIYIYVNDANISKFDDSVLKIKNYSKDMKGIPYISNLYFYEENFYTNELTNRIIKELVINKLL